MPAYTPEGYELAEIAVVREASFTGTEGVTVGGDLSRDELVRVVESLEETDDRSEGGTG